MSAWHLQCIVHHHPLDIHPNARALLNEQVQHTIRMIYSGAGFSLVGVVSSFDD